MEDHANITVPHNLIRKAFYNFSALREYSYSYSFVRCGHSPPVLIADGNWKIAFDLPAHLFRRPNLDNISEKDTQVNVRTRWETIEKKMISSGFCDGNTFANPYACPLTYTAFTPWLGNCSRISDIVPKTEVFLSQKDRAFTSSCGLVMDEDTILQVLESKTPKREALVKACKALGVSHVGSTTDLINRLEELLLYKDLYPKMFIKLQKAGVGGVLHMTCTHSVVYYQSALWWQESARDHGDALLSFKHPPTVFVSDIAGRVARHVNNRTNQCFFQPYDGRLCANTTEHIQGAAEKLLEVRFPWVTSVGFSSRTVSANEATNSSDRFSSLHPVTGTSARFSLYDRFHQKNQRRQEELLRSLKLAPHLAALVNSSVAEQLNRELSSSKYSLCQMKDEHYMFSLRLYFHLHNKRINDKYTKTLNMQAKQAVHIGLYGKLTFRSEGSATAVPEVLTSSREPRTDCWGQTNIRARKEIPDFQLQNPPNPQLDHVLDETQSPEEIIGAVGTSVLKRLDLMSLGLNQEVEATVVNCCLSQLSIISGQKGKDVHAVNSYAVATWQPPLNCDPFLSLPDVPAQSASVDCGVFMLMYALYMALNWEFDFTQHDMVHIRRWWVNLILSKMTHARKKRCTSAMSEAFKEETKQQEKVQNIGILMLPDAFLLEILLHVVLEEGDAALLNLSLVCSKFRSLVDTDSFQKRAHFCWLDSVTKWRMKSEPCQEFFKMYTLQPCRHCNEVYKNCLPGYVGRGKRGEMQGFYSENTHPGFCSDDCKMLEE
ncbi:uncharacterized protein LOC131524190 isoform X3 [Onychostoma macrolepis]|uniref:uncharacterized protein LOC131524190 isoform X3 n=1 Tax=Onychostoma macrolepis TaxID=369639 RepID=UPI00272A308C|nr:uncharacterized protein LOC131524190 isoform X3 [Onychostoma macrolepis]